MEGERLAIEVDENRILVTLKRNRAIMPTCACSWTREPIQSFCHLVFRVAPVSVRARLDSRRPAADKLELTDSRMHELIVGSEKFRDLPVALPATEPSEHIGDGLLPTVLFHTLYINSREGFVIINPRRKKN